MFNRVLCKESIKLEPKCINKEFKTEVLRRLKQKAEGMCTKHGFIKHNSIEVHKITPGVVELISLCGNVVYDVYFYADVCNPLLGTVIQATISNINRFGILAESGYNHMDEYVSVIEIIVAKNSVNIQSDVDLDELKIGDEIRVEILGRKFELGAKKISSIGRVIKDIQAGGMKRDNNDNNEEEEEEVYEEDDSSNGSQASEEEEEKEDDEDDEEDLHDEEKGSQGFFSEVDSLFSDVEEDAEEEFDDKGDDESSEASESDLE